MAPASGDSLLLLMDTCGERGSIALTQGEMVLHQVSLPERTASAAILPAVREVLRSAGVNLHDLAGIGVVSGPGSFTGLRVGLAVAKGLCEAASLRLAAVSRLAVLAHASGVKNGLAVLHAGRGQMYVGEIVEGVCASERLMEASRFEEVASDRVIAYAEASLLPSLQSASAAVLHVPLEARHALPLVQRCLEHGGSALAEVDANYVRDEGAIHARPRAQA